jgi:hypothetical protein
LVRPSSLRLSHGYDDDRLNFVLLCRQTAELDEMLGSLIIRDIGQFDKNAPSISPLRKYNGHDGNVGDVDWHPTEAHTFASVGDDRKLMM